MASKGSELVFASMPPQAGASIVVDILKAHKATQAAKTLEGLDSLKTSHPAHYDILIGLVIHKLAEAEPKKALPSVQGELFSLEGEATPEALPPEPPASISTPEIAPPVFVPMEPAPPDADTPLPTVIKAYRHRVEGFTRPRMDVLRTRGNVLTLGDLLKLQFKRAKRLKGIGPLTLLFVLRIVKAARHEFVDSDWSEATIRSICSTEELEVWKRLQPSNA